MDAKTLTAVRMPNRDGFVPDPARTRIPQRRTPRPCDINYSCSRSEGLSRITVGPKLTKLELRIMDASGRPAHAPCARSRKPFPKKTPPPTPLSKRWCTGSKPKSGARQKVGNALIFEAQISRNSAQRGLTDEFSASLADGHSRDGPPDDAGKLTLEDVQEAERTLRSCPPPLHRVAPRPDRAALVRRFAFGEPPRRTRTVADDSLHFCRRRALWHRRCCPRHRAGDADVQKEPAAIRHALWLPAWLSFRSRSRR